MVPGFPLRRAKEQVRVHQMNRQQETSKQAEKRQVLDDIKIRISKIMKLALFFGRVLECGSQSTNLILFSLDGPSFDTL